MKIKAMRGTSFTVILINSCTKLDCHCRAPDQAYWSLLEHNSLNDIQYSLLPGYSCCG